MNGILHHLCLVCILILGAASPLRAQVDDDFSESPTGSLAAVVADVGQVVTQPEGPPPTPRHTGIKALIKDLGQDVIHLPSKENLFWVGVGGGLALAVHPADDNLNEAWVNSNFAHDFFAPGKATSAACPHYSGRRLRRISSAVRGISRKCRTSGWTSYRHSPSASS